MQKKRLILSVVCAAIGCMTIMGTCFAQTVVAQGNNGPQSLYINKKQGHEDFHKQEVKTDTAAAYALNSKISEYQLFAGTVIPGTFVTGLNSDLPGDVVAQVSQNVFDSVTGRFLLIPQGTRLIGTYNSDTDYAQSRGEVIWNRMIMPNGDNMVLPNFNAADMEGYSGIKDKVRSHYARVVWSAIFGGLATAGVAAAGRSSSDNSFRSEAADQAASSIGDAVNKVVQKNLDIQPTIIIRPGTIFNVIIGKDLILKPYVG